MQTIDFKQLIGKTAILCAVEGHKFRLGDLTFEAIENENDGYRSSLNYLEVVSNIRPTFKENVTIKKSDEDIDGIKFVNELGLTVLEVGTDEYDNYYPVFVFNFNPENLSINFNIDQLINRIPE